MLRCVVLDELKRVLQSSIPSAVEDGYKCPPHPAASMLEQCICSDSLLLTRQWRCLADLHRPPSILCIVCPCHYAASFSGLANTRSPCSRCRPFDCLHSTAGTMTLPRLRLGKPSKTVKWKRAIRVGEEERIQRRNLSNCQSICLPSTFSTRPIIPNRARSHRSSRIRRCCAARQCWCSPPTSTCPRGRR